MQNGGAVGWGGAECCRVRLVARVVVGEGGEGGERPPAVPGSGQAVQDAGFRGRWPGPAYEACDGGRRSAGVPCAGRRVLHGRWPAQPRTCRLQELLGRSGAIHAMGQQAAGGWRGGPSAITINPLPACPPACPPGTPAPWLCSPAALQYSSSVLHRFPLMCSRDFFIASNFGCVDNGYRRPFISPPLTCYLALASPVFW